MFEKRLPYRNKKILQAAKGEDCLANFTEDCTGGGNDTIFCHFNEMWAGKGMGQKADDCAGFFGCQNCHKVYDANKLDHEIEHYLLIKAYYKTIRRLLDKGIIK